MERCIQFCDNKAEKTKMINVYLVKWKLLGQMNETMSGLWIWMQFILIFIFHFWSTTLMFYDWNWNGIVLISFMEGLFHSKEITNFKFVFYFLFVYGLLTGIEHGLSNTMRSSSRWIILIRWSSIGVSCLLFHFFFFVK